MLRFLLDAQIPPSVVPAVRARRPTCEISSLIDWRVGTYRTAKDEDILVAAHEEGMTLVTYDLDSIPGLLQSWGSQSRPHAGVLLIDRRTVAPNDVGGLVRILVFLWDRRGQEDWTNVVDFLRRAPG